MSHFSPANSVNKALEGGTSVFNKIRCAMSGRSQVSVKVLLKVNYCLKYSYTVTTGQMVYLLRDIFLIIVFYLFVFQRYIDWK